VSDEQEITRLLSSWRDGDKAALERLAPLVYEQLRRLARSAFRDEGANHTLQPTALINEAWLQLAASNPDLQDRGHFYALTARMMRRLLVNHAKARNAQKRGGDQLRITLEEGQFAEAKRDPLVLDLHEALDALARKDPELERVLELHYFGGHNYREIAGLLEVSEATAKRRLRFARAWVRRFLAEEGGD
jgi:RNA polymerase sigma factor (TIGR02999 family)